MYHYGSMVQIGFNLSCEQTGENILIDQSCLKYYIQRMNKFINRDAELKKLNSIYQQDQTAIRVSEDLVTDWRKPNTEKPKLLVSPEELIKPIEDIWDEYT